MQLEEIEDDIDELLALSDSHQLPTLTGLDKHKDSGSSLSAIVPMEPNRSEMIKSNGLISSDRMKIKAVCFSYFYQFI